MRTGITWLTLTLGRLALAQSGAEAWSENHRSDGYRSFTGTTTPTWTEAIDAFRGLADAHHGATLTVMGADDNGQPIHLFILHDGTTPHPDSLRAAHKRILWITNGIHAGEPDGVDASLLLARALLHSDQYMGLLANTAVCIVPVYNVSGAQQRNSHSRANQNGPDAYGFRANARNLDLNRDFIKADARNTRDLLKALAHWDPDIYLETHVSNGADHQYVMELLTTHPDRLNWALVELLETRVKPEIQAWMDRRGHLMCPYFETVKEFPEQGLEGFLDGPRYSSGHAGLRNRIGILSETHMLKPFEDRVNATFQLMLGTLAMMDRNGQRIQEFREWSRVSVAKSDSFGFNYVLDTTHVEQLPWKGYRAGHKHSAVSGLPRLFYDQSQPTDTVVPWMDRFTPTFTLKKPKAYLIPQEWREVIARLKLDDVPMEVLRERSTFTVEYQRIEDFSTVRSPYEGRYLHYGISTTTEPGTYEARPGDALVPMGHATDRLVMEILEPRSSDSYFAWGFFDSVLQQKEYFSSYVFEDIAAELLARDPALRKALEERKVSDPVFAADARAQLDWVYKRSPYHEPGYRRYPVVRVQ
ncbi:MAG: hypothetical protein KF905_08230 [Flavobacteriales bacterium]|nr:hypothetical protein [Flavobacteriales bacterium]